MYIYYNITACLKVQSKTTAIKPKILKFSERLQKISVLQMIFKVPPKNCYNITCDIQGPSKPTTISPRTFKVLSKITILPKIFKVLQKNTTIYR